MKNVTISMDEATLRWVRIEAARGGQSVSRWLSAYLERLRRLSNEKVAASARIEALLADFPGLPLSEDGQITIDRDDLYDDGRFRRFDHAPLSAGSDGPDQTDRQRGVAEDP